MDSPATPPNPLNHLPSVAGDQKPPTRQAALVAAALFILGLAAWTALHAAGKGLPPIRYDGLGHYLYLPGLVLHGDPTLRTLAEQPPFEGQLPTEYGLRQPPGVDGYLIKYPMGTALLMLPFFTLACLASWLAGTPLNGFAGIFQWAAILSGLSYGSCGVGVLWSVLRRDFSTATVAVALLALTFGTNLFNYLTFDSTYSHIYSFFLACVLLRITWRLYESPSLNLFILFGLISGLMVITRPTNAIWLLFVGSIGVTSWADLKRRAVFWFMSPGAAAAMLATVVAVLPQLAYWKTVTGSWIYYSYGQEGFDFTNPHLLNVLFSIRKGLFFWSPMLALSLLGVVTAVRRTPHYILPLALFLPTYTYVISSWWMWWYGGSFGHRAFVEALPAFAILLCCLWEAAARRRRKAALAAAIALCIGFTLLMMIEYWRGYLPGMWPGLRSVMQALQRPFGW